MICKVVGKMTKKIVDCRKSEPTPVDMTRV